MKCTISKWTYIEAPAEEQPDPFQTYELEGTHDGQPFHVKVSMEIDGRDAEYEQIAGIGMRWDADDDAERQRWDDLVEAMTTTKDLNADMERRSNAYFGE